MIFALITVVITVHAYVFYSLYVIHGNMFMEIAGESHVLAAIRKIGGVPVFVEMGSHEQHGQSDGFRRVCVKIRPTEIVGRSLRLHQ